MIAAARRRIGAVLSAGAKRTRQVDRAAVRRIEELRPVLSKRSKQMRGGGARLAKASGKRLRPIGVFVLRLFGRAERLLRRASALATKGATRASATLTPQRAVCGVIVAAALCLVVSQFVDFRSVEIGQPGYAGLAAASPPTVAPKTPVDIHSYLLIPIALLAAACAATMVPRPERRGLGRVVVALGLLSIAVILLVDLPAGLDEGAQAARFSGATAVLENGFYAQLAAAAGLVLGGLLYYARPCRIRINSSGRAASARRRRPRPRASSQAKVARSA